MPPETSPETASRWPAHTTAQRDWRQSSRAGNRDDRMLRHVVTAIPPMIAGLTYAATPAELAAAERAVVAIAATDAEAGARTNALGRLMLRTESVASSKIERVSASPEDFARAVAGSRANPSATSMVAATAALHRLVERAGAPGEITRDDLRDAHRDLMADDPHEAPFAGRFRDVQNWIGGSDHSPRGALFVPPPPDLVDALVDDLLEWMARDDVPTLVQAAIAHAQFESVHPFTDGNGRIGRALISALLRRRGIARSIVIPLASGILAVRDQYFAALTAYRGGDPAPIIDIVTRSAHLAAVEVRATLAELRALPAEWRALVPGRGPTVDALVDALLDEPIMTGDDMAAASGSAPAAVYAAIDRLTDAGVIAEITGRKRDRIWVATDVLGELDDLDRRIQAEMRIPSVR